MSEDPAGLIDTTKLNVILLTLSSSIGTLARCWSSSSNFQAECSSKVRDWQLELGHQNLHYLLYFLVNYQSAVIVPDSFLQVAHDNFTAVLKGLKRHEASRRHSHA